MKKNNLKESFNVERGNKVLRCPEHLELIHLEVCTTCNLTCPQCLRTIQMSKANWNNKLMTSRCYESTLTKLPSANVLALVQDGEPTTHPKLKQFIKFARSLHKYKVITFNTNALLHYPQYYKELELAGLTHLNISVDSLNQEVANICRPGTDVVLLKKRLSTLSKILTIPINAAIVVSRINIKELFSTLVELKRLGIPTATIQPIHIFDGGDADWAISSKEKNILTELLRKTKKNMQCVEVFYAESIKNKNTERKQPCARSMLYTSTITVDGFLTPCTSAVDPSLLNFITTQDKTWKEIWESEIYQKWIHRFLLSPHGYAPCSTCEWYLKRINVGNSK